MAISRRELLGVFWTGMVAGLMIAIGPVLGGQPMPTTAYASTRRLLAVFRRRRSAVIIGRECLRQHPQEADPRHLLNLIGAGLEDRSAGDKDDHRVLAHWLQDRFREDFNEGRSIRVEGWVLSQTEARLCALAALLEGVE